MKKASIMKRIIAYIIDGFIGTIMYLIVFGISMVFFILGLAGRGGLAALGVIVYAAGIFGGLILMFAYMLIRDGLFDGRSLGKKLVGIRVIKAETQKPCSIKDSVLRNITLCIPLLNFIELLIPFVDAEGKRIGDKIAGTWVVE